MTNAIPFNQQWQRIHDALLDQKAEINRAIREYPLPITACDDQFNLLLEKRSAITLALGRLHKLNEESEDRRAASLNAFVAVSQFVTEDAVRLAEV